MKKEISISEDNSFGVASVILGIFSIMFSSPPLYGIILGIISLVFANKQQKRKANRWGKNGKVLAIIGIILSVVFSILFLWLLQNPEIQLQLLNKNGIA